MAKVVIEMGYRSFVMDAEQGLKVLEALSDCEIYESKYRSAVGDTPAYSTQHIYPMDSTSTTLSLKLMSNEAYQMFKLAGKPE
jgi:hypothetical protein